MTEPRWLSDVEQQAWQGLLVFVNRGIPELERSLKQHDLLMVHYGIFVALSEAPDHTLRLSELADFANLSQSRLTHRMKTLTDRGFVAIEADPQDGRAKNATLTNVGMKKLKTVAPLHAEDVQQLIFDHLDDADTVALASIVSKIAGGLCDHELYRC